MIIHGTKRFNLLFPYTKVARRHSCRGRLQTIFGKNKRFTLDLMEFEKYHKFKRYRQIQVKDKLDFFNSLCFGSFINIYLCLDYPEKQQAINRIIEMLALGKVNKD